MPAMPWRLAPDCTRGQVFSATTGAYRRGSRPKRSQRFPSRSRKHCNSAVWLIARRQDELHTSRDHTLVGGIVSSTRKNIPTRPANCRPTLPICWSPSARAEFLSDLRRDEARPIASAGHHWSATVCLPPNRTSGRQQRNGSRRRSRAPPARRLQDATSPGQTIPSGPHLPSDPVERTVRCS
jgi:hypothetical protein